MRQDAILQSFAKRRSAIRETVRCARAGPKTETHLSSHNLDDLEKLCTHVALIERGRLARVETLSALTAAPGRVVYRLRRRPDTLQALEQRETGFSLQWCDQTGELAIEVAAAVPPEEINARWLPDLLPFGVVSVSVGRSLEEAYLSGAQARFKEFAD